MPSVRGREKLVIVTLFALSASASAAVFGFASGIPALAIGVSSRSSALPIAVGAGVAAVLLDFWRAPVHVRAQVPVEWGAIFHPRTVACLYGARMGVGPLTLLSTWLWWAAFVVGAVLGPWKGVAIGVSFAISRTVTMAIAVWGVHDGVSMSSRVSDVDARSVAIWRLLRVAVVATLVLVAVTGCSGGRGALVSTTSTTRSTDSTAAASSDAGPQVRPPTESTGLPGSGITSTTRHKAIVMNSVLDAQLLRALLSTEAVAGVVGGVVPVAVPLRHTGPIDLEAAAQSEGDRNAEYALLVTREFVAGRAAAWDIEPAVAGSKPTGSVFIVVYEFSSAENAAAYIVDGRERLLAQTIEPFPVTEIAGGFGFTQIDDSASQPFVAHAVAFSKGNQTVLVIGGSASGSITVAQTIALAKAQQESL